MIKVNNTVKKIEIKGLCKSFGPKVVLDNVDLSVYEGESLVVIGRSGTGKSVLIKNIIGILHPDSGDIYLDGGNVSSLSFNKRKKYLDNIGVLFQGGALFDSYRVWENVAFRFLFQLGLSKKKAYSLAIEKLHDVGLSEDVAYLWPAELSGGMQKRVALARAISTNPNLLFFDEPTTGLDPLMGETIDKLIRKCVRSLGATAVTITHDMNSVRRIADRVAMLDQGKVIWEGDIGQIDYSGNRFVQQFVKSNQY